MFKKQTKAELNLLNLQPSVIELKYGSPGSQYAESTLKKHAWS